MKFRNITGDDRDIPALGVTVPAGDTTPELSRDEAKGFTGQGDVWHPVGVRPVKKTAPKPAPAVDVKEND